VPAPLGEASQVLGRLEREQRPLGGVDVLAHVSPLQVVILEWGLPRQQLEADHPEVVHVRLLRALGRLLLQHLRGVPDARV